jgi:hypothetical protein
MCGLGPCATAEARPGGGEPERRLGPSDAATQKPAANLNSGLNRRPAATVSMAVTGASDRDRDTGRVSGPGPLALAA